MGNLTGVSGARFPKKPGGPLLSLETRHSVDSPSTSTPTSPVPPVTAPRRTKPPKESTVRYPSPKPANGTFAYTHMTSNYARLAQSVERETLNLKVGGGLLGGSFGKTSKKTIPIFGNIIRSPLTDGC
ncbi:hypothetical protein F4703DRAFT_1932462 [Phycomyces blakesleeanus]